MPTCLASLHTGEGGGEGGREGEGGVRARKSVVVQEQAEEVGSDGGGVVVERGQPWLEWQSSEEEGAVVVIHVRSVRCDVPVG
jgi:hypothetical protein